MAQRNPSRRAYLVAAETYEVLGDARTASAWRRRAQTHRELMMILGIETSCDETSVALLERDGSVRVNLIASQIERHQPFGGVVPEIASREHLQHLFPLVERALGDAKRGVERRRVDRRHRRTGTHRRAARRRRRRAGSRVRTRHPARAGQSSRRAHLLAVPAEAKGAATAAAGAVSVARHLRRPFVDLRRARRATCAQINRTRDDAIGETFDKVAKFIGLPYPGGPQIEKHARAGTADPKRFPFPVPQFKEESLDFSYSRDQGRRDPPRARARRSASDGDPQPLADFCATFQDALIAQLFDRLETVWSRLEAPKPTEVAIAGGVAANGVLRERIAGVGRAKRGVIVRLPEKRYCTDNAAMIAFAGLQKGTPPIRAVSPPGHESLESRPVRRNLSRRVVRPHMRRTNDERHETESPTSS